MKAEKRLKKCKNAKQKIKIDKIKQKKIKKLSFLFDYFEEVAYNIAST